MGVPCQADVRLQFRDQEVSMEGYRKPEERPPHPLKRFAREKEAYEHLLHYGACEKGAVPHGVAQRLPNEDMLGAH